jgi:hypothetical protein
MWSVALAASANGSAGFWSWGHNFQGQTVNPSIQSGYNYWIDQYVHKHSGYQISGGWFNIEWGSCLNRIIEGGPVESYLRVSDVPGCGGYLYNYMNWNAGSASYHYMDSVA